jgi:hypothetical protein
MRAAELASVSGDNVCWDGVCGYVIAESCGVQQSEGGEEGVLSES